MPFLVGNVIWIQEFYVLEQRLLLGFLFYTSHLFWCISDQKFPQLFLFVLNISYPLAVKTDLL